MHPGLLAQYGDNFWQQNVAPGIAQLQQKLTQNGQQYGSFGGAALGQAAAQGAQNKFGAGLNFAQQLFGNQLQGRQSYFNGGPRVSAEQNQADVSRGLQVAGLQQQGANAENNYNMQNAGMANNFNLNNAQSMNQYNMNNAGMMNNFGLNNFSNQMQNYGMQAQQQQNRATGFGQLALGGMKALGAGVGYMNGNPGATLGSTLGNIGGFFGLGSPGGGSGGGLGGGFPNPLQGPIHGPLNTGLASNNGIQ
jgi:hypothetical protein